MAGDFEIRLSYNLIPDVPPHVKQKAALVVAKTAHDATGIAKSMMHGQKTGRIYIKRRHGQTVMHRASAPGEAPAIDTGALYNAIRAVQKGPLEWWVLTNEYAAHLEYGTRRMLARPFLWPTMERVERPFMDAMQQVVEWGW